ncbi:hypothetical protein PPL_06397 [Heterostelium album PN500]|uniref:Uncharacterized protein n=1 Tax=Heterostelium pallidum (strain ATCC 26659 / Pp 5 / PN500) TaxID=670386 RepID=D3BD17_HETP5|nr:hypothetical protein PPL_06397 [Heterostelium album PN500]EFA80809.1 hypothetical protein PPL_06397 [Heterostelium album PN500]|eukprot:XP_020432928.1 hypothetical protein PPL_06397 [Heterostelium album PN500]
MHAIAELMSRDSTLRELNLATNKISDVGMLEFGAALAYNNHIQILDLSRVSTTTITTTLVTSASATSATTRPVRVHCLTPCRISSNSQVVRALFPTLVWLILDSNRVGDEGAIALSQVIANNPPLQTISLVSNLIGESGGRAIDALDLNSTLKSIFIANNDICDNIKETLEAIPQCTES